MSATLGGLIKDYRLQKNISQLEIAFAMGWKEPSRLSRIEQGRVGNPKREVIDKLAAVIKLTTEEKNDLFYVGNYAPTGKDIELVQKQVRVHLDAWEYPAILYDFCWRVIDENKQSHSIFNLTMSKEHRKGEKINHVFERVFDPEYSANKYFKGKEKEKWHNYLLEVLFQFKHAQHLRNKEKWYVDLLKKIMNNDLFRELWVRTQTVPYSGQLTKFLEKIEINPFDHKKKVHFYLFIVPLLGDPRFEIEYHIPADMETMRYFKK